MRNTAALLLVLSIASPVRAEGNRTFLAGSLIIPMDLSYQDTGMLQAYGLVFQLLRQDIQVEWVIEPGKEWCDPATMVCDWDCDEAGSGPCAYPTAGVDFIAASVVVWDDAGAATPGDPIVGHGYRGGPFVISAAQASDALPIINAWNDPSLWGANPWADRSVAHVVTVHRATASFVGYVAREMLAAPTIAVFADGKEEVATNYLINAGIKQSNGNEFPDNKCDGLADGCGPGTPNPDMMAVPDVMGAMGTCDAPNYDHKNGTLFTGDGVPAYCQIMSMHWDVDKGRETVECDGGDCGNTPADCNGKTITYHGHEVVAEVRKFLAYPTHFFAECQAVNAYENTVPNPAWPFLDDAERIGHFLTTEGSPPDCPCTDGDFECITGGCDNGTRDCCHPKSIKELGAGFLIGSQPSSGSVKIFNPDVPYSQMDGAWETTGGSEPAYNLSTYLDTRYKNDRDVTFITGPNGPGEDDIWMTGFLDGSCQYYCNPEVGCFEVGDCEGRGRVSYLGGHQYDVNVPISNNLGTQGTRMFLNALFEADCTIGSGQPVVALGFITDTAPSAASLPASGDFRVTYDNTGKGYALDAVLTLTVPSGVTITDSEVPNTPAASSVSWPLGSVGAVTGQAGDPAPSGDRWSTLSFAAEASYTLEATLTYRVGLTTFTVGPVTYVVSVETDTDGDGVPDSVDPAPTDPNECGDSDNDTCDDCALAPTSTPSGDGPDFDGDGLCDAGDPDVDGDGIDEDGDGSGTPGDAPCSGAASGCDDNCPNLSNPNQLDADNDGLGDLCDDDSDNDGVPDVSDPSPFDPNSCGDSDADSCDDCLSGASDPAADGTDSDGDGLCDTGDPDDDNDGVIDSADSAPLDPLVCGDANSDSCDDCAGALDTDNDGVCDTGDPDDDGDGVNDDVDCSPLDAATQIVIEGVGNSGDQCVADDADDDNDGVNDADEAGLATNPLDADSDDDGLLDGEDPLPLDPSNGIQDGGPVSDGGLGGDGQVIGGGDAGTQPEGRSVAVAAGCGCTADSSRSAWLMFFLPLLWTRRKRRA